MARLNPWPLGHRTGTIPTVPSHLSHPMIWLWLELTPPEHPGQDTSQRALIGPLQKLINQQIRKVNLEILSRTSQLIPTIWWSWTNQSLCVCLWFMKSKLGQSCLLGDLNAARSPKWSILSWRTNQLSWIEGWQNWRNVPVTYMSIWSGSLEEFLRRFYWEARRDLQVWSMSHGCCFPDFRLLRLLHTMIQPSPSLLEILTSGATS